MDFLFPNRICWPAGKARLVMPVCALVLAIVAGCKEREEIREYTLTVSPQPAPTHRMLAAIVADERPPGGKDVPAKDDADAVAPSASTKTKTSAGPQAWFFKLVGPLAQVEKVAATFDQFVSSIRIGDGDRPQWTLPEGWSEDLAARATEFGGAATIRIDQDGAKLELTVSKLGMPPERRESWTLGNINRWRDQLKLPAIGRSELDEYTDEIKAGDATAIKVDYRGVYSGGPTAGRLAAKMAHFGAGDLATKAPPRSNTTSAREDDVPSRTAMPLPFDANVPAEWKPGQRKQFSVAAYEIAGDDGSRAAIVTVTPLGPRAGDLKMNVDLWRGDFERPERVEEQTTTIEIDGQKSDYVQLFAPLDASPRNATLAVIVRRPDAAWFFKLWGQADAVEREKGRFEEYVKSVRFK
jgi:hypothetical protein